MFACTAQDLATYDYSINEDDAQQRVQNFISAVNKKESINGISVHASQILRFIFEVLTLRKVTRKPN